MARRAAAREVWSAAPLVPESRSLAAVRRAAEGCRACPLWKDATQTVFGEGRRAARVMLVGEQPGDEEDRRGRPFVGPAGRLLDRALDEAGIDREDAYVTNVVKHFKWEPRGRARLHKTPSAREIGACLPWLDAEIELLRPEVLVLLGATAAKALLGASFRVTRERGRFVDADLPARVLATVHPSAVLRAPDSERRRAGERELVQDLRVVARALDGKGRRQRTRTRG